MSPRAWRSAQLIISAEAFTIGLMMYTLSWGSTWNATALMLSGALAGGIVAGRSRR